MNASTEVLRPDLYGQESKMVTTEGFTVVRKIMVKNFPHKNSREILLTPSVCPAIVFFTHGYEVYHRRHKHRYGRSVIVRNNVTGVAMAEGKQVKSSFSLYLASRGHVMLFYDKYHP